MNARGEATTTTSINLHHVLHHFDPLVVLHRPIISNRLCTAHGRPRCRHGLNTRGRHFPLLAYGRETNDKQRTINGGQPGPIKELLINEVLPHTGGLGTPNAADTREVRDKLVRVLEQVMVEA